MNLNVSTGFFVRLGDFLRLCVHVVSVCVCVRERERERERERGRERKTDVFEVSSIG